jgi:tRNA-specific 2-thiouridylase
VKIAVGLSGGVDSAMAAWLLLREGHEVVGVTMRTWPAAADAPVPSASSRRGCFGPCAEASLVRARDLARRLGIGHREIDLSDAFARYVLAPVRDTYRAGRTPNPCVLCNAAVKFGRLPALAREHGIAFDRFATGHYARMEREEATGRMRLFRGRDRGKDQSYFLARLSQAQLAEALFPLGELAKTEVLALARSNGFGDLAGREESQDFIAGTNKDLLFDPSDERPGPVMDTAGRVLGRHPGIVHCTVGQRQGIGVAAGERRYVKAIDAATDTVVVGRREELFRASCGLDGLSWIAGAPPGDGTRVRALLRYRHAGADAAFRMGAGGVRLDFDVPQFAVAPGQAAVLYAGDEVLGAGWILPEGNGGDGGGLP